MHEAGQRELRVERAHVTPLRGKLNVTERRCDAGDASLTVVLRRFSVHKGPVVYEQA